MGHVGLTPQSATMLGGFKTQGKTAEAARQLVDGALALEEAGAFSVVLEAVPAPVAAEVTQRLSVPTIGIGAGRGTDGQVLVYHDLLGLTEGHLPRFVKRYANLSREIRDALEAYAEEVRAGTFPEDEHTYEMPDEELERFRSSSSPSATSPNVQTSSRHQQARTACPQRPCRSRPSGRRRRRRSPVGPARRAEATARAAPRRSRATCLAWRYVARCAAGSRSHGRGARRPVDDGAVDDSADERPRENCEHGVREHGSSSTRPASEVDKTAATPASVIVREQRLLPGLDGLGRVVPQRGEDHPRPVEDPERPQPPLLLERRRRLRCGVHTFSVLCAPCLRPRSSSRSRRRSRSSATGAPSTTGRPSAASRPHHGALPVRPHGEGR